MSFWSENYSFIKDVYDTRVSKMIEWMDHVEMAIQKVKLMMMMIVIMIQKVTTIMARKVMMVMKLIGEWMKDFSHIKLSSNNILSSTYEHFAGDGNEGVHER